MISVVIPLYNKERNVLGTVQSVLNQSFVDFELIIVNDGSTDGSLTVVRAINDERIRIIDKPNGGVSSARNIGILNARNEYIAFLDGDDYWYPNHLEVLISLILSFRSSSVVAYVTRYVKSSNKNAEVINIEERQFVISNYLKEASKKGGIISSSNFAVKRSSAIEVGLFNEKLVYGEDVEFWFRLLRKNSLAVSTLTTAIYYLAAENRSDAKVVPLDKRYHLFQYEGASEDEVAYYDKLVSIVILDYSMQRAYALAFKVMLMYKARIFNVLKYFFNLGLKKVKGK